MDNEIIGSISIADPSPRRLFDISDLGLLQSLADSIINTFRERHLTQLRFKHVVKNLLVHKMQTIQPSVKSIQDVMHSIHDAKDGISTALCPDDMKRTINYAEKFCSSVDEIVNSARSLSMYVDANLNLFQAFEKEKCKIAVPCNVLDTIAMTKSTISDLYDGHIDFLRWMIDPKILRVGSHVSYPAAIREILLHAVRSHVSKSGDLLVKVHFQMIACPCTSSCWLYDLLLSGSLIIRIESQKQHDTLQPQAAAARAAGRIPASERMDVPDEILKMLREWGGIS